MLKISTLLVCLTVCLYNGAFATRKLPPSLSGEQLKSIEVLEPTLSNLYEAAWNKHGLDVVFVVDTGSHSTTQQYWVKQLLLGLSEIFVFAPKYTWASVVQYNRAVSVPIPMSKDNDVCSFRNNVTSMTWYNGDSYLDLGLKEALNQHTAGRNNTQKMTVLLTAAQWGNLGADPADSASKLRAISDFVVISMNFDEKPGLLTRILSDHIASLYAGRKLSFQVEMTAEYIKQLISSIRLRKTAGIHWNLDLEVSKEKCRLSGTTCGSAERCVCDITTSLDQYMCALPDADPPEVLSCPGPSPSKIALPKNSSSVIVTWKPSVFSDNSGVVTLTPDKRPGLYNYGTHYVTNTAKDVNSNYASCTFNFTVVTSTS